MLGNARPTTSSLDLVSCEVSDAPDAQKNPDPRDRIKIKMADLVESLDARELDLEEAEDIEYDGSSIGTIPALNLKLNQ